MDDLDGRDYTVQLGQRAGFVYYEVPLPTILMALSQESQGVFLDVGANTGAYTLLAAATNHKMKVYAFEPVPSVRSHLELNVRLNTSISHNIKVVSSALSSKTGDGIIHEHVNDIGLVPTSSSLEADFGNGCASHEVKISLITLDDWVNQEQSNFGNFVIDFMKIDVEGHEVSMMKGAEFVIAKQRPLMIVELLKSDFEFFDEFLKKYNYQDIALFPGEAKLLQKPRFLEDSWNHVFCPVERTWQFALTCHRVGLPIGKE